MYDAVAARNFQTTTCLFVREGISVNKILKMAAVNYIKYDKYKDNFKVAEKLNDITRFIKRK